ncbi:type IV secretion system protein VirB6 [Candidatus Xenohaliotis californiensis]|uniref:Type IV secretion system protein VirB6 n=1 Tax=Candidatus Xenohaliotis californiensis TaxID=84677 RepID=A0ABM9N875_9RICK|nr:type IV secretion system protein VirB6 [Candidatus Xenohaliotis californiensis]
MHKVIFFLIICLSAINVSYVQALSEPRITGNSGKAVDVHSKFVSSDDKNKMMSEYKAQLVSRVNGTLGLDVDHYECDLAIVTVLIADMLYPFVGSMLGGAGLVMGPALLGSANDIACWWSVVRNPVAVYPDVINPNSIEKMNSGHYKKIAHTSPDANVIIYTSTDNYEEAVRSSMSEYLTVCQRLPLPVNVLTPQNLTSEEIILKDSEALQWLLKRSGDLKCAKGKAGDSVTINSTVFDIYQLGDRICAKVVSALGIPTSWPQNTVGCHRTPVSGVAPMCPSSLPITNAENVIVSYDNTGCYSCYISPACYKEELRVAQSPLPIATSLVQCFLETVTLIVTGSQGSSGSMHACVKGGMLYNAQKKLFQTLQALLVLSLTLYGIKIMMGQDAPKKQDVVSLVLKITLILYFCAPDNGGMRKYYKYLQDLTVGLADILIASSGNQSICNYKTSEYVLPADASQMFRQHVPQLALWDRLDCRVMHYLGTPAFTLDAAVKTAIERGNQSVQVSKKFMFFIILIPAIITGQLIVFIAAVVIVVFVFAMVVWALQIYLLSALALAIVVVVSPLFIPMALFQYTKPFFDNWLKELIAYTLYPALLIGYLGFFFTVIDEIYFGDLVFERVSQGGTKSVWFTLASTGSNAHLYDDALDTNTPLVLGIASGLTIKTQIIAAFLPIAMLGSVGVKVLYPMLKMALALLMFMFFNRIIVTIVGELSGGSRSAIEMGSSAQDPLKTVKQVASVAQKGAKLAKKGAQKAKEGIKKAATKKRSGGSSGGSSEGSATKISRLKK